MAKSLIEELPRIVSEGRREAAQILERLSGGTQIGLQTNELVLPSKDVSGLFKGSTPQIPNAFTMAGGNGEWMNRLIYGDNLLAMQALLAGDAQTGLPHFVGRLDLSILILRLIQKLTIEQKYHYQEQMLSKNLQYWNNLHMPTHGKMELLAI